MRKFVRLLSVALLTPMMMLLTYQQVSAAQPARRAAAGGSNLIGFPMPGMLATEPGEYGVYRLDQVEKKLLEYYQDADNADFKYLIQILGDIDAKAKQLNQMVAGESNSVQWLVTENARGFVNALDYIRITAEVRRLKVDLDTTVELMTLVPSVQQGKSELVKTTRNTVQIPRLGKSLDLTKLKGAVEARVAAVMQPYAQYAFILKAPNGAAVNVVGIDAKLEPGKYWDAKVYDSLMEESKRVLLNIPVSSSQAIRNFNLMGRQLMQGMIQTFGDGNQKFLRPVELNQEGVNAWMEQLAMYFFTRDRVSVTYGGVRLGVPAIAGLEPRRMYLEYLFGGATGNLWANDEFVGNDKDLRVIQNNIFQQLTKAETQANFGKSPVTMPDSTLFSVLSYVNWIRVAVTGDLMKAKMNAAVLALLYKDIDRELKAETLNSRQVYEGFQARYLVGKTEEELKMFREWDSQIAEIIDPSAANPDDLYKADIYMTQENSYLDIVRTAIQQGFNVKMAHAAQSRQIAESAKLLLAQAPFAQKTDSRSRDLQKQFQNAKPISK